MNDPTVFYERHDEQSNSRKKGHPVPVVNEIPHQHQSTASDKYDRPKPCQAASHNTGANPNRPGLYGVT